MFSFQETRKANNTMLRGLTTPNFSADATSEAKNLRNDDHHVDYAVELPSASVMQVQVGAYYTVKTTQLLTGCRGKHDYHWLVFFHRL